MSDADDDDAFSCESEPSIGLSVQEFENFSNKIMNLAYEKKIRTMKRGWMATSKSGIYKKNPRPYVMLILSHFIAYTIFPSIVIYKHLPGKYFASMANSIDKNSETVAWMGQVNVGSFLISYGLAILLVSKKCRPDQVDWKSKTWLLCSFIAVEAIAAIYILSVTIVRSKKDADEEEEKLAHDQGHEFWLNFVSTMAFIAMIVLSFLHGLITAHFLTMKPAGVYREQQPQAYAERDFVRHFGICFGILVQLLIIYLAQPCFYSI